MRWLDRISERFQRWVALLRITQGGFAPKNPFIHTGLQPGGETLQVIENRFNGFLRETPKTVQTVFCCSVCLGTGLKPGVNETTFEARLPRVEATLDYN
jgi:hypothetical protein